MSYPQTPQGPLAPSKGSVDLPGYISLENALNLLADLLVRLSL